MYHQLVSRHQNVRFTTPCVEKQDTYWPHAVSWLSYPLVRTEKLASQPGHTNSCLHKNVSENIVACLLETLHSSVWSFKVNFSQHFCRSICSCCRYHLSHWDLPACCPYGPATYSLTKFTEILFFPVVHTCRCNEIFSIGNGISSERKETVTFAISVPMQYIRNL